MITDPIMVLTAEGGVCDDLLAKLGAAGGTTRRLAPGAAEVTGDVEALRAVIGEEKVDVNVLPREGREKRLLIADMDSTMIGVECIDEIADFAGVKPQVAEITERAMHGELDFEAALRARVGLLEGLPEAALEETFRSRIRLNPGARTLVQTMAGRGAVTALVSGGFTYFTERVAAQAGFSVHQANTLIFEDGKLTGAVKSPILGREAKREALLSLCAEAGITPAEAVAVGDGANDLAMVELAGLGVAYRAKPALAERADARVNHGDLTALLSLQGIGAEDYAG